MKKSKQQTTTGFNALVWQENDIFVAKAIEVELASQGKTSAEAITNLEEAIELYFENDTANLKTNSLSNLKLHPIFPKINYA